MEAFKPPFIYLTKLYGGSARIRLKVLENLVYPVFLIPFPAKLLKIGIQGFLATYRVKKAPFTG
ncbi:hypothetical protein LJC14_02260 [Treponema sp. OttesenSCG-928-L16]|nr:hypothetical protein [Treponema sp. OttesenSCG-928-L16]